MSKYRVKLSGNLFNEETNYLDEQLMELYQTEYAIAELNNRMTQNDRLGFRKRCEIWIKNLRDHALDLANKVTPEIIETTQKWISEHSQDTFANGFIDEEFGLYDEWDGNVKIGYNNGKPVYYNITNDAIHVFLEQNPIWVQEWASEMVDPEDIKLNPNYNPENFSDADKLEYVYDSLVNEYKFKEAKDYFSYYGNFDEAVRQAITQNAYPKFRQMWGSKLNQAESQIRQSFNRLTQAYQSQNLNQLFVAINLALHVEHVTGIMADHMNISHSVLDHLSNLDTEEIDMFVDQITGEDWKSANNLPFRLLKQAGYADTTPSGELFDLHIADTDRYSRDRYYLTIGITHNDNGHNVGFHMNNAQTGLTSYSQYWIYYKNELSKAKQTFNEVKKSMSDVADLVQKKTLPMANITPMLRKSFTNIDPEKKQMHGTSPMRWSSRYEYENDYRSMIYGNRYPGFKIESDVAARYTYKFEN